MHSLPQKSVQPTTLFQILNGNIWSFSLMPAADTGGRGFIIDPPKRHADVSLGASCLTLDRAVDAARKCEVTRPPSPTPVVGEPVRMVPLVNLDSPEV